MQFKKNSNEIRTAAFAMAVLLALPGQVQADSLQNPVFVTDTAISEQSLLRAENLSPQAETNPPQTETNPPQTETNPPQTETNPPQTETNPPQTETNPPQTETNPSQTETNPPETETNPSQTETNSPQAETELPSETITDSETPSETETESLSETESAEQTERETPSETQTEEESEAETEKKKKKEKESEKPLDREAILNNYKVSAPFTNLENRIRYDETVPLEGIPSFITQEMVIGALWTQDEYGYPASVTLAQIIAESGFGSYGPGGESGRGLTLLAYGYCNLFGIKGSGTAGSISMKTWEMTKSGSTYTIMDDFRAYHTYTECIEDRAHLIENYYSDLIKGASDANTFAVKLGSRWATNLYYGQTLISLMETYDLYRLDNMTLLDFSDLISGFADPCPGGTLTSPFGYRDFDQKLHKGIDLGTGTQNLPTYAAASGTVLYAGYNGSAGNMVTIDHGNGLITKYMHHQELYVSAGDKVEKGQQIGLSGNTGNSTGNHLHFQVEENGIAVDPIPYLTSKKESTEETETAIETAAETAPETKTETATENESTSETESIPVTETEETLESTSETEITEETDTAAESNSSLKTVIDRVNIRKEASQESAAVSLFKPGMKLLVLAEEGEWTQVRFEDTEGLSEGFIRSEYLIDGKEIRQAMEKINVRREPSVDSEKIGSLETGKKMVLMESASDGWVKIRYSTDTQLVEGFVKSEYLEETDLYDGVSILVSR